MDDVGNLPYGDKTGCENTLLQDEGIDNFKLQSANKNTIEKRSLHMDY
jgi:hypothetical protein